MTTTPATLPLLVADSSELRRRVVAARRSGQSIGLVPTMGALHEGHLSLVDACRRDGGLVIVTIFVNPTQFAPGEDFGRYPRRLEADLQLLAGRGAALVFAPPVESMYGPGHATFVDVGGPALPWEGEHRPGHFRGVATIVLKLFNLAEPDRAYFGRKDYQQALVIQQLVKDLDLPIRVEVCPIVREVDGLAMSSRNIYLTSDERRRALAISTSLRLAAQLVVQGTLDAAIILARMISTLEAAELKIDYVALVDPHTLQRVERVEQRTLALIAARVGNTRLIDNELIG